MNLAIDGYPTIIGLTALSTAAALWMPSALLVLVPLLALSLWFYRDPKRFPLGGSRCFVSPADGKVVEIFKTSHPYTGPALKIGIFMNPLDVHVNRMPTAGKVEFLQYVPGKKWIASGGKASQENERFYLGYRSDYGPVLLVQIAGLLARRIVCRARRGQTFQRGARFGMIKLGSKVDLYLPMNVECKVQLGQKVLAGVTVIGEAR